MAHEISWLVQGRVIYTKLHDELRVEDLREQARQLIRFLDEGEGPLIHAFIDLTSVEQFPIKIGLINAATVDALRHPKLGWTIIITNNRMLKYITAMVTGLSGVRHHPFTSHEEGLAFLNEVDSTLPNLLAWHQDADI